MTSSKARYRLFTRANLLSKAMYKREPPPTPLHDTVTYADAKDFVTERGQQDQVYFIEGLDSNLREKWVHNRKDQWHRTNYRQELSKSGVVISRAKELPEWHTGNPNKGLKV